MYGVLEGLLKSEVRVLVDDGAVPGLIYIVNVLGRLGFLKVVCADGQLGLRQIRIGLLNNFFWFCLCKNALNVQELEPYIDIWVSLPSLYLLFQFFICVIILE